MRCGKMRHVVTLQSPPTDSDSFGQSSTTWVTVGVFRAFVKPLQGRELAIAQQLRADISHSVTMRWLGTSVKVDGTMRLLYKGRYLNIISVINVDERNKELDLVCQEITSSVIQQ